MEETATTRLIPKIQNTTLYYYIMETQYAPANGIFSIKEPARMFWRFRCLGRERKMQKCPNCNSQKLTKLLDGFRCENCKYINVRRLR